MGSVVSKLSLYDILAMVIPGGTILLFLSSIIGFDLTFEHASIHSTFIWIAVFVLSYLLGLINHVLTAMVWKPFRNNIHMINRAHDDVLGDKTKGNLLSKVCCILKNAILVIAAYVAMGCCLLFSCRCNLLYFGGFLIVLILLCIMCCCRKTTAESDLKKYYKAYYAVAKNRYSDDIFIMEGQVAFIQNMLFPIFLLLLLPDLGNICIAKWNCIRWFLAFGIIALIYVVFERQLKIYQRVWTDSEYLS